MEFGKRRVSPVLWALTGLIAVLLLAFVLVVGPWLFTRDLGRDLTPDQELKARNDVRATLVQAVGGLALAGGLVLTYRTYTLSRSTAVTETYTKAVEQLGHEKAPVRLGAVHSLAQLGQDYPARRQTVIDVLCAYLRLPYAPTGWDGLNYKMTEEHQVRQTIQRLLATHLRTPSGMKSEHAQALKPSRQETFWPGMCLDLSGANLVDVWFNGLSAVDAKFDRVIFFGHAFFEESTFSGDTWFREARFTAEARFHGAIFTDMARFGGTTFEDSGAFVGATFIGDAWFDNATFTRSALFGWATFTRSAEFPNVTFTSDAWFLGATFKGFAEFTGATFTGNAAFRDVTFASDAHFNALVSRASDPDILRVWPPGWTVRINPDSPDTGVLVNDIEGGSTVTPASSE